jgi:citrate lyase subunit gamma (acyl carrier protein)
MAIIRTARAGTDEDSDIIVEISPGDTLSITLESKVETLYGKKIRAVIEETLKEMDVSAGTIHARDRGALDYAIRARVKAAVRMGREDHDT